MHKACSNARVYSQQPSLANMHASMHALMCFPSIPVQSRAHYDSVCALARQFAGSVTDSSFLLYAAPAILMQLTVRHFTLTSASREGVDLLVHAYMDPGMQTRSFSLTSVK